MALNSWPTRTVRARSARRSLPVSTRSSTASLIDAETIQLARQHQVALSMDVYNGDYTDTEGRRQGWPEEFLRKNIETTEAQRRGFTAAHAAGVPIVLRHRRLHLPARAQCATVSDHG